MTIDFLQFFSDPVLRAPTIGCMLMGLASSLVGVLMCLKRQALIGEVLSHTAFPGIVIGAAIAAAFSLGDFFNLFATLGAALGCLAGSWAVGFLKTHLKVKSDAALCFVLAVFFGLGVLISSELQLSHAILYKQALLFLYGQVATMTDSMIGLYAVFAAFVTTAIILLYNPLQALLFDRQFSMISGLRTKFVEVCISILLVSAIVVGIRSIGVVLMAGMLIAPAIAARRLTNKLWGCFLLAGVFGILSSFLGNVLSVEGTRIIAEKYPGLKFSLPTGPLILLVAAAFALVALFCAPDTGIIARIVRMARFRRRTAREHLLKAFWKKGKSALISREEAAAIFSQNRLSRSLLKGLVNSRHVIDEGGGVYRLSDKGWAKACRIVRMHRLWEVYLVDYLSQGIDKVHRSAEELEHIISPELEEQLEKLLGDLRFDPHRQPIPSREEASW